MKAINIYDDIRTKNGIAIYSVLKSIQYADDFSDKDYDVEDFNERFSKKNAFYYHRKYTKK